jgi:hypothetical protein
MNPYNLAGRLFGQTAPKSGQPMVRGCAAPLEDDKEYQSGRYGVVE